jgi:hypothetical protein
MLEVDPHKRITIRQAIEHPWIAEGVLANDGADPSASPANNAENYMRVRQSAKHPSPRTALPPRDLSKVRIGNLRGYNETKAKTTEASHNLDTTLLGDTLEDVIATTTQILSQFDRSKLQGEPKAEKLEKRTPERSFGALSRFDRSKLEGEPKAEKLEKRTPERSFGALSRFDPSKLQGEPKAEEQRIRPIGRFVNFRGDGNVRDEVWNIGRTSVPWPPIPWPPVPWPPLSVPNPTPSLQPSVRKRAAKPIPQGHEAIQHHETLSPVVQSVFLELGFHLYSFTMMLCERYGEDLDNIVLFVWIPPASTYYEPSYQYPPPIATEEDLVSRLKECCQPFGIEVEIRHGVRGSMAATEPWGSEKPAGHFFLSQLHLGAGIKGRRYFGTIGGLLIDRKTGKKYALTCGHVLKSSDSVYSMDSETVGKVCGQIEAIKSQWLERIAENLQQLEHRRRGPHDTHNMLEDLLLKDQLHELKQASIFFEWQEKQIEQVRRIESQEKLLNVLRIGKVEAKAKVVRWVNAGKVFALSFLELSDYLLDGKWKGQDWALMEADGIVPGSNAARWPTWLGFPGRHHTLRETPEPAKDKMSVVKMGRSTGFTDGKLSTVPVISGVISKDGPLVCADLAVYPVRDVDFAQPGDSGALAFDKHGRVVGMVYSGIRPMVAENIDDLEQTPRPVFLESFHDIKSWINEELDMDVVLDTDYGAPPWWAPPQHSVVCLEGEGMRHEEEQVAHEEEQVARPTDGEASNDDDEFNPVQSITSTSALPPVETSGPIRLISVSETVPVEQRTRSVEAESYMESATMESTISIDHHFLREEEI